MYSFYKLLNIVASPSDSDVKFLNSLLNKMLPLLNIHRKSEITLINY